MDCIKKKTVNMIIVMNITSNFLPVHWMEGQSKSRMLHSIRFHLNATKLQFIHGTILKKFFVRVDYISKHNPSIANKNALLQTETKRMRERGWRKRKRRRK